MGRPTPWTPSAEARPEGAGTAVDRPSHGPGPLVGPALAPTRFDPVAAAGSQALGGVWGRYAVGRRDPRPSLLVMVLVASATFAAGIARTVPCMVNGWADPDRYEHLCYSDVPVLYFTRGLADGMVPYLQWPADGQPVEYPVLTGLYMWIPALLVRWFGNGPDFTAYYLITLLMGFALFLVAVVATALTVPRRRWDGMLLAAAPAVALAASVNWDLLAVALTALSLFAWSRRRPGWAGVLLGLAVAAKFYPVLLVGPLLVLAWRRRRMQPAGVALLAAAATWAAVNLPVYLANAEGWSYFFLFSADRGQDLGSVWLALSHLGLGLPDSLVNPLAAVLFAGLCVAIAALTLVAPRPPRLAQVSFLVLAAFLLTNKVYSPQFVLWLLPLAVLARPRWRELLWWQAAQAAYFVAVWMRLLDMVEGSRGISEQTYAAFILLNAGSTAVLVGLVLVDVWSPGRDPVRVDGAPAGRLWDDPGGGVLDGAPDRFARTGSGLRKSDHPVESSGRVPDSASQPVAEGR